MPDAQIAISRIGTQTLRVPLLGTAPLIVHKFSEKSKLQMLDAMQGRKTPKQPKDPEAEYEAAFYRHDDDGYGLPVIAFKAASVSACRLFGKAMPMTQARQFIFMDAEFTEWQTTIDVTYVTSMLTKDSVISLIDAGGLGVGVGEWRPEKNGDFGTYGIDETREIEVIS
jgi:hypothetical protein